MVSCHTPGPIGFVNSSPHVSGQEDRQTAFVLPLQLFSAENWSSLREPATLDVATKLMWHYCADGFISHDDPVCIRLKERIL